MPEIEPESLKRELARSRDELLHHKAALAEQLNLGKRVQQNFRRHSLTWLTSGAAVGLIIALCFPRRSQTVKTTRKHYLAPPKESFVVRFGKFAFEMVAPTLVAFTRRALARRYEKPPR